MRYIEVKGMPERHIKSLVIIGFLCVLTEVRDLDATLPGSGSDLFCGSVSVEVHKRPRSVWLVVSRPRVTGPLGQGVPT